MERIKASIKVVFTAWVCELVFHIGKHENYLCNFSLQIGGSLGSLKETENLVSLTFQFQEIKMDRIWWIVLKKWEEKIRKKCTKKVSQNKIH